MTDFEDCCMSYDVQLIAEDSEEDDDKNIRPKSAGKRKTGREYRKMMKLKKKKSLIEIINRRYIPWAGWIDWGEVDGKWVQTGKFVKYPKSSNTQRYLKKVSNKKVRKAQDLKSGRSYRKIIEYWWILD
jgi:hypothetical protein